MLVLGTHPKRLQVSWGMTIATKHETRFTWNLTMQRLFFFSSYGHTGHRTNQVANAWSCCSHHIVFRHQQLLNRYATSNSPTSHHLLHCFKRHICWAQKGLRKPFRIEKAFLIMSMVDLKRMQGSPPAPTESKRRWNKSFSDKNLLSASLLLVSPTKRNNSPRHDQPQQKQQRRSMMALSERFVGIKNETFSLNLNSDTTSSLSNSSWGSVKPSLPSSSQSSERSLPPRTSAVRGITNRRRVSATPRNSVSASRPAPQKSCLKEDRCRRSSSSSSQSMRRSHKTSNKKKSTVDHRILQFTTATIHEHGVVLGDNPSVSVGAPIQIDWKCINETIYDVDIFEYMRSNNNCSFSNECGDGNVKINSGDNRRRRSKKELSLSVVERAEM